MKKQNRGILKLKVEERLKVFVVQVDYGGLEEVLSLIRDGSPIGDPYLRNGTISNVTRPYKNLTEWNRGHQNPLIQCQRKIWGYVV